MKPRPPVARDQVMFMVVLVLLSILTVILWFMDPAHRYAGKSRVAWPPPASAKP